jgi:hypothetical protein
MLLLRDISPGSARISGMWRKWLFAISLALLFGLGQQGAAVHAISHYADLQSQQPDKSHTSSACEKCVAYAQLAGAVPMSAHVLPVITAPSVHALHIAASCGAILQRAYSARAPPVLA